MGIHQAFWFGDTSRNVGVALTGASVATATNAFGGVGISAALESHCEYIEIWYGHMLSSGISGVIPRYFTSQPYPIIIYERLNVSNTVFSSALIEQPIENVDISAVTTAGGLTDILRIYNDWIPEPIDISATMTAGGLTNVLVTYNNWLPEPIDVTVTTVSGTLT